MKILMLCIQWYFLMYWFLHGWKFRWPQYGAGPSDGQRNGALYKKSSGCVSLEMPSINYTPWNFIQISSAFRGYLGPSQPSPLAPEGMQGGPGQMPPMNMPGMPMPGMPLPLWGTWEMRAFGQLGGEFAPGVIMTWLEKAWKWLCFQRKKAPFRLGFPLQCFITRG